MADRNDGSARSDERPWLRQEVVVGQEVGTHLRVVKRISERVGSLDVEVRIESDNHQAAGTSILDLLQLGARTGERVTVSCRGVDEQRAMAFVTALLEARHWNDEVDDG